MPVDGNVFHQDDKITKLFSVAINTLTIALTCNYTAVSATCWGSFTQLAHLLSVVDLIIGEETVGG